MPRFRRLSTRLRLSAAGDIVDRTTGQPLMVAAAAVPPGGIILWSGALTAIPDGWALCDGTQGTPDLRDRFIKGAAAGIAPGLTGGAATHTHDTHGALTHAGAAVADHASHTHDLVSSIASPALFVIDLALGGSARSGGPSATLTHAVTQPNDHAAQAHSLVNHEPAYYTLAFLMKL